MKNYLFSSTNIYAIIDPPPILVIKYEFEIKDKNLIKINLRHNLISATSKTYEFKMGTFESGHPEENL